MEEAERLCDRVALIDAGRVIATDTPSGLASRAGGDQQIRFRASAPLDEGLLAKLPEVSSAHRDGDQFTVTGNEDAAWRSAASARRWMPHRPTAHR